MSVTFLFTRDSDEVKYEELDNIRRLMKMVMKLPATVKILKIIQLTVIPMTIHKLQSSGNSVVQKRVEKWERSNALPSISS